MPPYVYYDRRSVTGTETQFFHESRTKHADVEIGTNMPKDAMLDKAFKLKRIVVQVAPQLLSSATARDGTLDDQILILLNEAVIELQIGEETVHYFPACAALGLPDVKTALHYTLATAADGSYGVMSIGAGNGAYGLEVDIDIPADTTIKFFLKTKTTPALGTVTCLLYGERA